MKIINSLLRKYLNSYSGLSLECWQSIFLTFFGSLATGICFFLSLYFVNVLHISIEKSGLIISFYGIGTICGGIIGGKLSDYLSAKRVSTTSLLIQANAFFLLNIVQNEILLTINMFIIGCCLYGFTTSNNLWLMKKCKNAEMKMKSINISRAASNLGMGFAGTIIGMLDMNNFKFIFYFSSAVIFISGIYLLFFVSEEKNISSYKYHNETTTRNYLIPIDQSIKIMLLMLICLFLIGLIIAQLSITYPIYIQDLFPKMGLQAVSILFIFDTVIIAFLQAPLVNFLKNKNKIMLVGIGALLMGLGMFLLTISFIFPIAILSCVIWTTGEMIFIPMIQFVCYECGLENKKGHAMGIMQAIYASSRVIGPSIGGYIYNLYSGKVLWSLSMLIGTTCFLACHYFKKYDYKLFANSYTPPREGTITSKTST